MDLIRPEELAYMRETQAEARPTEATLRRRVTARTPSGGSTDTWDEGQPVQVRIDSAKDDIPEALASRYGIAGLAQASLDLVHDVRSGDRLEVSAAETYEVVSDGENDEWATAQTLWLNRLTRPAR